MNEMENQHYCCRHCPVCQFEKRGSILDQAVAQLKANDPTITDEDIVKALRFL